MVVKEAVTDSLPEVDQGLKLWVLMPSTLYSTPAVVLVTAVVLDFNSVVVRAPALQPAERVES